MKGNKMKKVTGALKTVKAKLGVLAVIIALVIGFITTTIDTIEEVNPETGTEVVLPADSTDVSLEISIDAADSNDVE